MSQTFLVRISVVTPSFRNSTWLKLCIASVADQEMDVEHIVQDAGSDDGTLDWLPHEKRVAPFVEKDRGMYDAINLGLKKATGEILAYLNCDEQYLPGALSVVRDFFRQNPRVDVLFADIVIVDSEGQYLCHRKVQLPLKYHTWLCHLNTLTCATFFHRRVIEERGIFFDPNLRYDGDGQWVLRLLKERVPMSVLRQFTSAYTQRGENLGLHPEAQREKKASAGNAPRWARQLKPVFVLHHWLRRLAGGIYFQRPFRYAIYTRKSPVLRITHEVARPGFRWEGGTNASRQL